MHSLGVILCLRLLPVARELHGALETATQRLQLRFRLYEDPAETLLMKTINISNASPSLCTTEQVVSLMSVLPEDTSACPHNNGLSDMLLA